MAEIGEVQIVLAHLVFDNRLMNLHLGDKTIQMWHTPGHSPDCIVCLAKEDRILFASDTLMPVPHFVDGDYDDFVRSLHSLQNGGYGDVIHGHGERIPVREIRGKK